MNVELVLHAGDYIAPFVASHFKPLKAPLIGVFGNNDGDRTLLKKKFAELGADIRGNFAFVVVDGLKIALLHGDETELMRSLLELESHDVLVSGHTHVAKTYRKGRTLVINPGEACGYLSGKPTISILDTKTLNVKTIQLNKVKTTREKINKFTSRNSRAYTMACKNVVTKLSKKRLILHALHLF